MKVKLLLITFFISCVSYAQNQASQPSYSIITTNKLILPERAAVRIAITKIPGNTISGYRKNDNSFFVQSKDEASSKAVREKIEKFYRNAVVIPSQYSDFSKGFTDVVYRVILPDPAFPIYIETGDHELDETSYQYEKSDWQQAHPKNHK